MVIITLLLVFAVVILALSNYMADLQYKDLLRVCKEAQLQNKIYLSELTEYRDKEARLAELYSLSDSKLKIRDYKIMGLWDFINDKPRENADDDKLIFEVDEWESIFPKDSVS